MVIVIAEGGKDEAGVDSGEAGFPGAFEGLGGGELEDVGEAAGG